MKHGGPEALRLHHDLPKPEPGSGDVRIKVLAAGLNNTDIWSREGAYGTPEDPHACAGWRRKPLELPRIQGGDIAGRIDAVGDGVSVERIGERVIVNPVLYSDDSTSGGLFDCKLIGSEIDGGFADYTVAPSGNAFPVDSPLSDAKLASLPIAYLTGEHMLASVNLAPGETVLVTGASGGVGSALVQLAKARGAIVVAVAASDKISSVRALGANYVVARELFEEGGGVELPREYNPLDVVADVVAGPSLPTMINVLRYNGRYVTAGAIAGPNVTFDLRTVYLKHLTIQGSTLGTQDDFRRVVTAAERALINPPVAAIYRLEDLVTAQEKFRTKDFVGNIVVIP